MSIIPKSDRPLTYVTGVIVVVFIIADLLGSYGPILMKNGLCFTILGCNTGFGGYDAFVHLLSGVAVAMLIIWSRMRFPALRIFNGPLWRNLLILVSLVLLFGFVWEFAELLGDQFRMAVLHENLFAANTLYQPRNIDTMGDLLGAIVGALLTTPVLIRTTKKK